jgi:hypothetical protein
MQKAVITGDIVNFTSLDASDREILVKDSKDFLQTLNPQKGGAEFFRGDSFQLLLNNIRDALYKSIQIRCWFKKGSWSNEADLLDARIAIGVGEISYFGESVLDSDGEAFHLSGRAFDKMETSLFKIVVPDEKTNNQLDILAELLNVIIADWSKPQAEVVFMLIEEKTQQQIALELGVSQSAVNKRIKLSKWKEIERAINYISVLINELS